MPRARCIFQEGQDQPGPLTSTFLISMSIPMVTLPLERLERCQNGQEEVDYVNDRPINEKAAGAFDKVLDGVFGKASFFKDGAWRYATHETLPLPKLVKGLPEDIADALGADDAAKKAANMPTKQWCKIIRNSMAHGGIAYLDEHGRSSYGTPVKMYAFFSGKPDNKSKITPKPLIGLNFLRISENDYFDFLRLWVDWLEKIGFRA